MTPKTEQDLAKWMKENCFNFNSYSINGNAIYEGYGIDKVAGQFIWYYTEKGQKEKIKVFDTEEELIEYAYNKIQSDKWAKTHCIGFTTDKNKTSELTKKLEGLKIEFMQDEIPYYGLERPVYRTFVFGCDYHKVANLKKEYYDEK